MSAEFLGIVGSLAQYGLKRPALVDINFITTCLIYRGY
jgi:hypothetical protein